MKLARLPYRIADAPTNMAVDLWMLSRIDRETVVLFRNYGWSQPAFTFGYTQRWAEVCPRIPGESTDCCRRPSGGGIVDHRNDWTYALAISSRCSLGKLSPLDLYRSVHLILSECLIGFGINCDLFEDDHSASSPVSCFERPSPYDVVFKGTARKIAGAALKRTKAGVLLQGTVDRACLSGIPLDAFESRFVGMLIESETFDPEVESIEFPEPLTDIPCMQEFRDETWNRKR